MHVWLEFDEINSFHILFDCLEDYNWILLDGHDFTRIFAFFGVRIFTFSCFTQPVDNVNWD